MCRAFRRVGGVLSRAGVPGDRAYFVRTTFLAGTSVIISFFLGTLLGIVSAWRRG
jgi:hypothetical protein